MNSRTDNNIEMKHGPITKYVKGNMAIPKKIHNGLMLANHDAIIIFLIYS